ncbi:MAG: DUF1648 domain-containing protein [Faecalimonas sp.]|nr:DUF1648 domain-containing protein [Faecalimonas sp.]
MMEEQSMHMFKKLHRVSLIIGALAILLPIVFWNKIPDTLPMHYNAAGKVDNWSDKSTLILLFFVIALLMGVMSIAVYLVKTNMESRYSKDAEKSEMRVAYPIVILMNLVVQIMFAYIMFCCVTCRPLGTLFLPIFLTATFAPLVYLIYKCGRIQATSGSQKAMYNAIEKTEQGVVYRTAVDWWLGLLLGGCEALMIWIAVEPILKTGKIAWGTLLMAIGFSIIIIPLFGIRYVLYSEHLLIFMSIYGKARVRYADIVEVKKTMNPLSSAAMSLKRIQIDYLEDGVHRMILISPIKRKIFIKELEDKRERSKS